MTMPLLSTKLYIPPPRSQLLARPRLIERLETCLGVGGKLALVSAPAGFGKTTLLSQWASGWDQSVAWISLDVEDNDPTRFWSYVIAALQSVYPDVGGASLSALQSRRPEPLEPLLTDLANEINLVAPSRHSGNGATLVLVVDDFHSIVAPPVQDSMAFFLDSLPPGMRLVLSSRTDPPWPLARWRARGELVELRTDDMRLTFEEAVRFLDQVMGLKLDREDVKALENRTEGWVAGLQMAALSMQGRRDTSGFVKAFTGSHRFILDYLVEEVLEQQPPQAQSFLLQTSVLDRMTASLCEAVIQPLAMDTAAEDVGKASSTLAAQRHLESVEQANLFLVSLDDERLWYRYHSLFADLLRKRLHQSTPDLVPALHQRASQWFERHELYPEAVRHALQAGDTDRVASLVERNALAMAMVERGELTTLLEWLGALPDQVLAQRPWLNVAYAWALLHSDKLDELEPLLSTIERSLMDPEGRDEHLSGHVDAIRAQSAAAVVDLERAITLARRALTKLLVDDLARDYTVMTLFTALRLSGDVAAATQVCEEALPVIRSRHGPVAVELLGELALLQLAQGQLRTAERTMRQALDLVVEHRKQGAMQLALVGQVYSLVSDVQRQMGNYDAAVQHARTGLELCRQLGHPRGLKWVHLSLANALYAVGDLEGALAEVREAKRLAEGFWASGVAAFEALVHLAKGDLAAASRWVRESGLSVNDEISLALNSKYRALAMILMAQGDPASALRLLDRLLETAQTGGSVRVVIVTLPIKARCLWEIGERGQALASLEQALTLAEPGGWVNPFVLQGAPMVEMLRQVAMRVTDVGYVGDLLSAFRSISLRDVEPMHAVDRLSDPLTERELEVLKALSTGASNSEIAGALFITSGTVKNHLRNIYRKLDAHNRTQAVKRARSLGLV